MMSDKLKKEQEKRASYASSLDELREATMFVLSESRAKRYEKFSRMMFRFASFDAGEDVLRRRHSSRSSESQSFVLYPRDVATITTSEGSRKYSNSISSNNNNNGVTLKKSEDEELAYALDDILPRNKTLFEILSDILDLSFNNIALCRAQQKIRKTNTKSKSFEKLLRLKSTKREKRYAARVARSALLCVGTTGITTASGEDTFKSFAEKLVEVCVRELKRLNHNTNNNNNSNNNNNNQGDYYIDDDGVIEEEEEEEEERDKVEKSFLEFYDSIRKNMRDKTNEADWTDDDKRRSNIIRLLEEKDGAYASLVLQAELLETLIALVAERPRERAMLSKQIEAILEIYVRDEDKYEEMQESDMNQYAMDYLLETGGDEDFPTKEERANVLAQAQMQINDASGALLALLTKIPVHLPNSYVAIYYYDGDAIDYYDEAFEISRTTMIEARAKCAKILGGENYLEELLIALERDIISRYTSEKKARLRITNDRK